MLDAIDGAVGTEDRILNFVEDVRVDRFRGEIYLLTLGAFGLHVVLPEEALFLAHTAASTSSTISSALFVATSRVCPFKVSMGQLFRERILMSI